MDVLGTPSYMAPGQAVAAIPAISRHLTTLVEVGLGYVRLGQPATTLSGGEAQRVKLASELQKRSTGSTVYVLDEPTTGLHFEDIRKLLGVLSSLVDKGNTVLVIEHNLDVIKTADWVIDMGPAGGNRGGTVVATGTPEDVAAHKKSFTGEFLKPLLSVLSRRSTAAVPSYDGAVVAATLLGRHDELAALRLALLSPECRLLTLTGPPGRRQDAPGRCPRRRGGRPIPRRRRPGGPARQHLR